jgi:hypothetical protein
MGLNWIYVVSQSGKRTDGGPAHLIGDDPETTTLCGLNVEAETRGFWESVPHSIDPDKVAPTCDRCTLASENLP